MREFHKGFYSCKELVAYDALELMPGVLSLFPDDELFHISNLGNVKNQSFAYDLISNKTLDEYFVLEVFYKTNLTFQGFPIQDEESINEHFKDVYSIFNVLSWVLEVNYKEAFSRKVLEIEPHNNVARIDKIMAQQMEARGAKSGGKYFAEGVPPPNINKYAFKLIAQTDKNKRCDWELLYRLKTDFNLPMFLDLLEVVESVKTYEAAEAIKSI